MHNWRLLLLAIFAVFQPIASFTERSGVDGSQRCDYRTSLLRDPGLNFHGTHRFTKPAVLDRRLNQREDVSRIRHNEVRGEFRTPLQSRFADALENSDRILPSLGRFQRTEYRLNRNAAVLSQESPHERISGIRQAHLTTFDDERRIQSRRSIGRLAMERRQEPQGNRYNTEAQRARDIRNIFDRVRDVATDSTRNGRRIARERTPRMDMPRSETKMQLERSANRELNRAAEFRGSLMTGARVNRANEKEDYRSIRKDISRSLDRDERQSTRSRRTLANERQQRTRLSRDSLLRERVVDERVARDVSSRIRDLQSDQPVENRRDLSNIESRYSRFRSNRVVEAQRESRNNKRDTRLNKVTRFEENRVSRNSERGNSIETRRGENVIRNMERDYRTTECTVENRRNVRSQDRESQRNMRNTVKDSRAIRSDPERDTEVRREARYVSRQSCSLNNERNTERRSSERVNRLFTERDTQDQRSSRNSEFQRDAENERATREVRRESPGRNIRINFGNTRLFANKRSQEARRETRNAESRRINADHENRRDNERRSQSFDRLADLRRDTRENNHDARILRQKRSSETREANKRSQEAKRETRNAESRRITGEQENQRFNERRTQSFDRLADSIRDTRENNRDDRILRQKRSSETQEGDRISRATRDISEEIRRSTRIIERQSRITRDERNIANRRAIRTAEMNTRSTRRENSAENRRDIRKVNIENRRTARNTENDFPVRDEEKRVVRARDSLSMDRKGIRETEHLNIKQRETPVDSKRIRSVEESRRISENMDLERRVASARFITEMTRKREFLSATGKYESETSKTNWQYLFYTLQGLYLCGILMQLMNEKGADVKTRSLTWWSAPQHLIKVD